MKIKIFSIIVALFISSCNSSVNSENLIGKWVYVKVEFTNQNPVIVQEKLDLKDKNPHIIFNENGSAVIYSSGNVISKGKYVLENKIIRYEETLQDGQKRKIPFLIKELNQNKLIFESMEQDVKRITAEKEAQ